MATMPSYNDEQQQGRVRRASDQSSTADTSLFSGQIPHDAGTAWAEERTRVAVGHNVNVSGKLIFTEPVRIEGRFRGEVRSVDLVVIAEAGSVEGKVTA